jgi:transcriptional regulator with XRE-family HTH domain
MYLCGQNKVIMDIKATPTVQIIQALGKRFKEYRIAARMTQKEVAEQSGVSLLTIRRFEQGYSYDIKLGNLIALLKAIDFADGIADILPEFPVSPYALARQEASKPKRVRHGQQH